MSTAIVLPTLTQWAEGHITTINKATNDKDLSHALDDFLSKNATIIVNGVHISCAEYEKQLQGEKFQEIDATVSFLSVVQVHVDKDKPFDVSSTTMYLYKSPQQDCFCRPDPWDSFITPSLSRQLKSVVLMLPENTQLLSM